MPLSQRKNNKIPEHVAIIPDGNRRWAKQNKSLPWIGHGAGAENFDQAMETFFTLGVKNVTFWAASLDNLRSRSRLEVLYLVKLMKSYLIDQTFLDKLIKRKIKARFIGQWRLFINDREFNDLIIAIEQKTAKFTDRCLTILLGYDGQEEMLDAFRKFEEHEGSITRLGLRKLLWTGFLPDVDLVIRTGGEPHWSAGFMMWQTANSQLYFSSKLWPDFSNEDIKQALNSFSQSERRFGT